MNLCNYLSTQPCFDDTSIAFMDQIFIRRRCVKQEQILTGEGSRDIYFVESGLLRLFFYTKRRDITREFYLENSFYVPIEHVFLNASFPYRLESVTNSVIRVADYDRVSSAV